MKSQQVAFQGLFDALEVLLGFDGISAREKAREALIDARPFLQELATCDDCNEPSDELTEVDDSDPSVGYHSTLQLCTECLNRRKHS